jgi:3-hydroxyacyl-CoA dehydrogenase
MRNVTVFGNGVLGSQIIFQTAVHGFKVTACGRSVESLDRAKKSIAGIAERYQKEITGTTAEQIAQGLANITYTTDRAAAVADADLVIEAIIEDLKEKQTLYEDISGLLPERTIVCTNSSTLLPSDMVAFTGRPGKFLGLHYANHIWIQNSAEIMGTDQTDPAAFAAVMQFATDTGMVAVPLKKEKAGWLLNSLLVPLCVSGCLLYAGGYAEPKDIDSIWRIGTGAPHGPFEIMDVIGLKTVYQVLMMAQVPGAKEFAAVLKSDYIDEGKLGTATGEGFYSYKG